MEKSLFSQYVFNSKWSITTTILNAILQIVFWLFVAQYISQEGIGKVTIVVAATYFFVFLINWPFNASLVQKEELTIADKSGVFWLNTIGGIIVFILILFGSFVLEWIYYDGLLRKLMITISVIAILDIVNSFSEAILKRRLEFQKIGLIRVVAQSISVLGLIYFLKNGIDLWSIIYAIILRYAVLFLLYTRLGNIPWREIFVSKERDLRTHFDFGKFILGEKCLTSILSNADTFLIGKYLGFDILGVYELFRKIIARPFVLLTSSVESVAYSILSKLQMEKDGYIKFYKQYAVTLHSILFFGLFLVALNMRLILNVLPNEYARYDHIGLLLVGVTIMMVVLNPIDLLLYTKNRTKDFFKWQLKYFVPYLILIGVTVHISIDILLLSTIFFYLGLFLVSYDFAVKPNGFISRRAYFSNTIVPLLIMGISFIVAYYSQAFVDKQYSFIVTNTIFVFISFIFFLLSKERREMFKQVF